MAEEPTTAREEKAEAARIRRRWINLGELLAVAAVVISGLGLYNSWSERRANEAQTAAAAQKESKASATITLVATSQEDGRALKLASLRPDQAIQDQTIRMPAALGVSPIATSGDPRIEAEWFAKPLLKILDDRARQTGDARLPVLVTTRFLHDGELKTAAALYDVGYAVEDGGFLAGRKLRLKGLSLIGRGDGNRLEALWRERLPPAKKQAGA